jgi:hypothetical protein
MKKSIRKRVNFSKEQDLFLEHVMNLAHNFEEKLLWNQVAILFNEQFPSSTKAKKQIHYQNCIQKDLKNGKFSKAEQILFHVLTHEKQINFPRIAREMNRTIPSVKKYYYRKYIQSDQFRITLENCEVQSSNDFPTFPDDLSIFGIRYEEVFNKS